MDKPIMAQARIRAKAVKDAIIKACSQSYLSKPHHSAYAHLLEESEADVKQALAWLKKCHPDPDTKSYIIGAQELATITKYHEKHILKNSSDDRCRICKNSQETVFHILGACDSLAKREYFSRHNNICKYLHYKISQHYNLNVGKNWYHHEPEDVTINDKLNVRSSMTSV